MKSEWFIILSHLGNLPETSPFPETLKSCCVGLHCLILSDLPAAATEQVYTWTLHLWGHFTIPFIKDFLSQFRLGIIWLVVAWNIIWLGLAVEAWVVLFRSLVAQLQNWLCIRPTEQWLREHNYWLIFGDLLFYVNSTPIGSTDDFTMINRCSEII